MNTEPTELNAVITRRRPHTTSSECSEPMVVDSSVLDEAFADLPPELVDRHRIDQPANNDGEHTLHHSDRLLGKIATEVAALNRRCSHLSHILRTFDPPASPR